MFQMKQRKQSKIYFFKAQIYREININLNVFPLV